MPDVRDKLRDLGPSTQSSTPQQFSDLNRVETDKVAKIIKDASIKFEQASAPSRHNASGIGGRPAAAAR